MDILRERIYKSPAQMGIAQASFYSGKPIVSGISICMDITLISFQECFRIFSSPSRLVLKIPDRIFRPLHAAVNPHIRIGSILPPRFFQYLYMSFIDMQISLIQKFLPETMNDVLEPIPVDDQKPV